MNIIITGSEGFIGTHLKERLIRERHSVIGIDNLSHSCNYRSGEVIKKDIFNIDKNDCKKADWIIHLAAQINVEKSLIDPIDTVKTNTLGTLHMLELSRKYKIPMIFASTTEIYGDKQTQRINENHVMNPKSPYAAAKMGADGLCKAYYYSYDTKVITVRNFNTFGMYQSDDKWGAVIAKFADRLIQRKSPIVFGDGNQKRDFMSYKDAIDFYMLLLKGKGKFGEDYNVGMGKNISIKELALLMIKIFEEKGHIKKGSITPIYNKARPGEVKEFLCDNRKSLKLGWKPDTNFKKLLEEYIEWKLKCV